jgi:hypothetical protein
MYTVPVRHARMSNMEAVIWGFAIALTGGLALPFCISRAFQIRKARLDGTVSA